MRFFLLAKICRQQNTASSGQIYAGLRAPQTPRARLAAWAASQNYVLLFQPAAFIPASAGQYSQTAVIFFYRANLSLPVANIITFLANPCRHNSKSIRKNNSKKSNKKKEAEASLRKITVRTYQLLPHNVQQPRSFCWYIPHTKTRPSVCTFWQNISFHQNALKICRHRFSPEMSCCGSLH